MLTKVGKWHFLMTFVFTHFTQRPIKTRDLRGSVVLLKHSQESQPSRLVVLSLLAVADSEDHGTFGLELTPVVFSNQLRPSYISDPVVSKLVHSFSHLALAAAQSISIAY